MPKSKKVSTPSTDTYIKINTIKMPRGPIVAGLVAYKSTTNRSVATNELTATNLPNIFLTISSKQQESPSGKPKCFGDNIRRCNKNIRRVSQ